MLSDLTSQEFYQLKDEHQCANWNLAFFQFANAYRRSRIIDNLENKEQPCTLRYAHFANLCDIGYFPTTIEEREREEDEKERHKEEQLKEVASLVEAGADAVFNRNLLRAQEEEEGNRLVDEDGS